MTLQEALALCEELRNFVGEAPGANPEALKRAKEIAFCFGHDFQSNAYLTQKVTAVVSNLKYWCSERKWKQYGNDPSQLKTILLNNLAKLKGAIRETYDKGIS